ncbi:MAG: hypothetical protein KDM63_04365 [Verrucomicrobiae bacterium]|nr:hypothetical protein [Verrucomicrobiae bacterium]
MKNQKATHLIVGILFLLASGYSFAQESDPFAENTVDKAEAVGPPEPDHLIPVDPYPGDWHVRYTDQLRNRLGLDQVFYFRMLVMPSFSSEYSVSLFGDERNPWDLASAKKLTLKYSIADRSIWYSMPENNDEKKQKDVRVAVQSTEFPKALGVRLFKLWDRMLRDTRYPAGDNSGLDGVTYEFAMWCRYGEIWSPNQRKSPLLFIELGESLINLCKATPEDRESALKDIEEKAAQLEIYLNRKADSGRSGD